MTGRGKRFVLRAFNVRAETCWEPAGSRDTAEVEPHGVTAVVPFVSSAEPAEPTPP